MSEQLNNAVVWFEIYVDDMARAKAFYEAVFKISLTKIDAPSEAGDAEMWGFPESMERYGATGALTKMEGFSAGPGGVMIYLSCEDCKVEEGRVEAAGGQVVNAKMSIGEYGFISLINDSEGNLIGLHSQK